MDFKIMDARKKEIEIKIDTEFENIIG